MTEDNDKYRPENRRLRNFGITMAVMLSLIGTVLLWYEKAAWPHLFAIAAVFLIIGLAFPKLLNPIESVWMKLAFVFGTVATRIILIVTYYLVVTPIGLLRQLLSKDPLDIKIDKNAESYWKPVDPGGSKNRPYKPY